MENSTRPGFWQTLPGVLTAIAGLITAVAGLIVVFDQVRARSAPAPEAARSLTVPESPGPLPPSSATPPSAIRAAGTVGTGANVLAVGPPNEVRFKAGDLVFGVQTARLDPFNQDTRVLSVTVRVANNMKSFDRNYYSELRALADDLPLAPEDPPLEQIEAHSVKDIPYRFRVPAGVRTLVLRITRMEEAGDIPLHLK